MLLRCVCDVQNSVGFWDVFGMFLVWFSDIQNSVGCVWDVFGMFLQCFGHVFAMSKIRWDVFGMCLGCFCDVFGMFLQ